MTKETYFCDRCGNEMPFENLEKIKLFCRKRYRINFPRMLEHTFPARFEYELCEKCSKNLEVWLSEKNA